MIEKEIEKILRDIDENNWKSNELYYNTRAKAITKWIRGNMVNLKIKKKEEIK